MNEEEVQGLVDKVLNADETIHSQILGLQWRRPDA